MSTNFEKRLSILIVILFLGFAASAWCQDDPSQQQQQQQTAQPDQSSVVKEPPIGIRAPEADTTTASDDAKEKEGATESQSTEAESENEEHGASIDSTIAVWGTHVVEDSSKAEEYGQIPQGFLLQYLRAYLNMKNGRHLDLTAVNVGLNDGQYAFDYGVYGRYKFYFDYNKIPHLFSKDGVIIFNEQDPGQWRLADSVQQAIQNLNNVPTTDPSYQAGLAAQQSFISNLITEAHPTFLGLQRNRGTTGLDYSFNTNWKANFQYFQENRQGFRPLGTALSFSWVIELPEHIDYHTYRPQAGIEYTNKGTTFSATYQNLDFVNETQHMIWDNPYRITDRAEQTVGDGTSQGQLQLPADNHGNMFSATGATSLGKGQISGIFSYYNWKDSVDLLPYTINSALPQVPLPSSTFNGDIQNINTDIRYYRPVGSNGNLTVNYRLFDQSNKNDQFVFTAFAPLDASVTLADEANPLFAYKTNTLDFDFNLGLGHSLRALAGYTYNHWDRDEREVTTSNINSFRLGLDSTGSGKTTFHARYQYDHRTSDHFDLDNPVFDVIPLRRFDTANLNRNYFRVMADFAATDRATLEGTVSYQNNDYPDSQYGVLKSKYYTLGGDFSYAVTDGSTLDAWYEYAKNASDQLGRQSGSTVSTSTTFDWAANLSDQYNTVGIDYLMNFKEGKMSWDTSFIYAQGNGFEDLTGGSSIRPTGAVDLPNADDTNHVSFKTQYSIKSFKHARIMAGYWFDKYTIDDFAENAIQADQIKVIIDTPTGPSVSTPGVILLNARQGDYNYSSGWIGVIYSW